MKRKYRYIAARVCGAVVMLLLTVIFVLQLPSVQTGLAEFATEKINGVIDGRIEISSIRIIPPGTVVIKDLVIIDDHPLVEPDTFFYAGTVAASLSWKWLLAHDGITIAAAKVKDGGMVLVSEPTQYLTNLSRIFGIIPPNVPAEPSPGTVFSLDRVRVENFRFRLKNRKDQTIFPAPYGLDFSDLDVSTDVIGHDMHFTRGVMYATCDHCSIWANNCDYVISSITGNCRVGQGMTLVQNIHMVDNWSDLYLDYYSMEYRKRHGLREFATEVKLGAAFGGGHLALATIDVFTHSFKGNQIDLNMGGGSVSGYMYDLGINNLKFQDRYSGLSGVIDGRLTNITDSDRFGLSARLKDFRTDAAGAGKFLSAFASNSAMDLSGIAPGQTIRMDANISGLMNRMRAEVGLSLPSGNLNVKARVYNILNRLEPIVIDGSATTDSLNLGGIINGVPVNGLTMGVNYWAELAPCSPKVSIDSLAINNIGIIKGKYSAISAKGSLKDGKISLTLDSTDPNLDFLADASARTKAGGGISGIELSATINNIDLDTLGILDKVPLCAIRTKINANIGENERGILLGDVNIPNVSLRAGDDIVNTGAINLKARYTSSTQRIHLTSKIFDAYYTGSGAIATFISDLKSITTDAYLPSISGGEGAGAEDSGCGTYSLGMNFHKFSDVLSTIVPGIQIADSTKMMLSISNGQLRGSVATSSISIGGIGARKLDLSFDNTQNGIGAYVLSNEIRLGKIQFKKATTSLSAKDDKLDIRLKYDNSKGRSRDLANLNLICSLSRDENDSLLVSLQPYKSFFEFGGKRWEMKGLAMMRPGGMMLDDLSIASGNNSIKMYGGIGFAERDTLMMDAHNFQMSFFDSLMGLGLDAGGNLDGHALVSLPLNSKQDLDLDMKLSGTHLGEADLGDFMMKGHWNDDQQAIVATLSNTNSTRESISARAELSPRSKKINGNLTLDSLNLAIAKPFLNDILSELEGYVSGTFAISGGGNEKIKISESGARLQNAKARISYTGVPYTINGDLDLNSEGLSFESLNVTDMSGGTGKLSGGITLGEKGTGVTLNLNMKDLRLIDTPQKTDLPIYGSISASGNASVQVAPGKIKISADINADKQGSLHVPMNTALVSSTSDLLTFVSQIEYGKETLASKTDASKREKKTRLEMDARLRISPELTAWVEIDKASGNKMTVSGDGDVKLKMNSSSGKVSLNGVYTINQGDYHFVVPGLLEKDFNIKQGSSITLVGDLSDTRLDIKAGHPVRASISTLLSDTTAVGNRQAVDCIIGIGGDLKGPKLSFDIEIPNVDPSTRSQVESALNTEDKRQKQFMSLLVLGSFLPAEESGVVNGTNMLLSNVGEIMSGQINNIMQKLDIPLDFGFGYQQNLSGGNMYDVAISTQLFNNRVIVNGSVGSRQNGGSTSQSDVVGDIDVSVKLDKAGKWRATCFSHSANEYTSFLDNSQRNGVGVSYQKEFNRLKELFMSRKKLESLNAEEKKRVNIKVE